MACQSVQRNKLHNLSMHTVTQLSLVNVVPLIRDKQITTMSNEPRSGTVDHLCRHRTGTSSVAIFILEIEEEKGGAKDRLRRRGNSGREMERERELSLRSLYLYVPFECHVDTIRGSK